MTKSLPFALILFLGACSSGFTEKDGAYIYRGNISLRFTAETAVDAALLKETAALLEGLLKDAPSGLKEEKFSVEGLGRDSLYNLFAVGDALFLGGVKPYENKMLVYAFLASSYDKFLFKQKRHSPVPLADFTALTADKAPCSIPRLNSYIIDYSVKEIFFVSILEMLDRPSRYFFPAKTKEELFRVLFYPELVGFWDYMAMRFGAGQVFAFAKGAYTEEKFEAAFAEKISDIESAFVAYAQKDARGLEFDPPECQTKLDNLLNIYMTGTKKSLMKE